MIVFTLPLAGSGCKKVITGGFADVSGDNGNWSWNMTTFTKPITNHLWSPEEPNNLFGNIEDMIIANVAMQMMWTDAKQDIRTSDYKCYICEYSP